MEKRCANCGRMIEKGAQVCQHCGAAQGGAFGEWRDEDVVVIDPIGDEEEGLKKAEEERLRKERQENVAITVLMTAFLIVLIFCVAIMVILTTA